MKLSLSVGKRAPSFSLSGVAGTGTERREFTLDDYLDRWLVLLFYPRDFSLICPTELTAVSDRMAEFVSRNCDLLGISTDSVETHERWLTTPPWEGGLGPLAFALASDPDGKVSKAYNVYIEQQRIALRGLFIVDPNGVLQYQVVHQLSVGRSTDEVLRVLEGLQVGGLCPAERGIGEPVLDVVETLGSNRVLGPYRIEATLGVGAFGKVFRAHDTLLDRTVALKVLRDGGPVPTEALLAEARAAAALNHPNVCGVYSVDTAHGAPVIVMEYVAGESLAKKLTAGPLSTATTAQIVRQVAAGMAAAHEAGVVHGDLKPANLMVAPANVVKIMDFGLARRFMTADRKAETTVVSDASPRGISGTLSYLAPEQTQGLPASPASDVFSLGLILYESLTGRQAVAGGNLVQILMNIESLDAAKLAAEVPEPFGSIVSQALSHRPSSRITMAEIADALPPREVEQFAIE